MSILLQIKNILFFFNQFFRFGLKLGQPTFQNDVDFVRITFLEINVLALFETFELKMLTETGQIINTHLFVVLVQITNIGGIHEILNQMIDFSFMSQ